jgi:hypothetical protein
MWRYLTAAYLRDLTTDFAIWLIQRAHRYKDRCLASRLQDLAKDYEP